MMSNDAVARQLDDLATQLSQAASRLRDSDTSLDNDPMMRAQLVETAKRTTTAVQQPIDKLMNQAYDLPSLAAARLFVDWEVFKNIPAEGSISYAALGEKVGAEVRLISELPVMSAHPP